MSTNRSELWLKTLFYPFYFTTSAVFSSTINSLDIDRLINRLLSFLSKRLRGLKRREKKKEHKTLHSGLYAYSTWKELSQVKSVEHQLSCGLATDLNSTDLR
jgi:hypothetical protein